MRTPHRTALRVALTYGAASVAWILISGWLANLLPRPVAVEVEFAKGLFFVLVTSIALYAIIFNWSARSFEATRHALDAERTLSTVVRTVPAGVLVIDGSRAVTFMNPRAASLLGLRVSDALGKPLAELLANSDAARPVDLDELLRVGNATGIGAGDALGGEPAAYVARSASLDPSMPDAGHVIALADVSEQHRESGRLEALMRGYRFVATALAAVSRAASIEEVVESVCDAAVRIGGFAAAVAVSAGPAAGEARLLSAVSVTDSAREAASATLVGASAQTVSASAVGDPGDVVIRNDLSVLGDAAVDEGFGSSATFVVFPGTGSRVTVAFFAREPGHFDAEQHALLNVLAQDVVIAVDKLVLGERRLETEGALARSEERYRRLFLASPRVMWVYDADSLRFIEVNDAAVAKYGYSREQFLSMTIRDIRPPGEVERLTVHLAHKPDGFVDSGYWTHVDATGRTFPVHLQTHSIEWGDRKAVVVLADEVARIGG